MPSQPLSSSRLLIAVVDDDTSVRESLPDLLREFGFDVIAFATAAECLASNALDQTRCLLLDVWMPGTSGPMLQAELNRLGRKIPIVFITAHAGAKERLELIDAGAVDVLLKPFAEAALLDALTRALGRA